MQNLKSKLSLKVEIPKCKIEKSQSLSCTVPMSDCTHIIDNIYISGFTLSLDYSFLTSNKFTHIITVQEEVKFFVLYISKNLNI